MIVDNIHQDQVIAYSCSRHLPNIIGSIHRSEITLNQELKGRERKKRNRRKPHAIWDD